MSERNQYDDYRMVTIPDMTGDDHLIDPDDPDTLLPSTSYAFMDGGDTNSHGSTQHLLAEAAMEDVDMMTGFLDSEPDYFEPRQRDSTGYLAEDGEEDREEGEDRLMEESERERQSIETYQKTHPDIKQQQQGGREIDEHEAIWKVSTFRPDWGVEKMRDNNPLTYWQSDCPNPRSPHTVDLYFHQATFIKQVSIFIDFLQDESYSPKEISIRGGTCYRDLHEIVHFECDETVGWKNVDLSSLMNEPLRVFQLQIAVLSTHLNGRDVHIRQIKVYSVPLPYLKEKNETDGEFKTRTIFHKGLR